MTRRHLRGRHRPVPRLGLLAALVTGLVACGSDAAVPVVQGSATPVASAVGAAAASTRAAELEAGLTAVLVERTYVAAAPRLPGAADALDAVSLALADVLAGPHTEVRRSLVTALRACDAQVLAADDDLPACGGPLEAVVREALPRLSADQLEGRLAPAVGLSTDLLRGRAARARGTARTLAGAAAADLDVGATATPASTLRADLTWLLVEHVALATARDREGLAANGADLRALVTRSAPSAGTSFGRTWNAHLDRLTAWTDALAAGPPDRVATLRSAVLGLATELGPALAPAVRGLPSGRLAQELDPALQALLGAVEASAAGRPDAAAQRARAVADVLAPAALLAAAVAEDRRLA